MLAFERWNTPEVRACQTETRALGARLGRTLCRGHGFGLARQLRRWLVGLWALCLMAASTGHARADQSGVDACLAAHTRAQEQRLTGHLLESRESLNQCSSTSCPRRVRQDCLRWLEEIQIQTPSIGFNVSADGTNRADVTVFIDGQLALEKLNGRSVDVNPGAHRVRVELPPYAAFERELVVTEGEKFRVIEVTFVSAPKLVVKKPVSTRLTQRPVPVAAYVFAGIGAAAAANGAVWGGSVWLGKKRLQRDCAPNCSAGEINALEQRALIADVSFGVSALALASAATIYFLRPEPPDAPGLQIDVSWLPARGALASLRLNGF
jgi:hypothetical protein